jgi:hypothetical protein
LLLEQVVTELISVLSNGFFLPGGFQNISLAFYLFSLLRRSYTSARPAVDGLFDLGVEAQY